MVVLALGVKKSLIFNNVLNVINFASWVFIMSAGLFYASLDNWSNFLPNGWSGVSMNFTRVIADPFYTLYVEEMCSFPQFFGCFNNRIVEPNVERPFSKIYLMACQPKNAQNFLTGFPYPETESETTIFVVVKTVIRVHAANREIESTVLTVDGGKIYRINSFSSRYLCFFFFASLIPFN